MKSGTTHSSRLTPLHGLIILAFAAIMLKGFGAVWDHWISSADASFSQGNCVYQVFQGERCVGTVFFDEPRVLETIVKEVGTNGVEGVHENGDTVPCNRVVRLTEHPPGHRVEMMSGHHLLCAGQRIDINVAGKKALTAVPWIGPRLADKIVTYRLRHGPYGSLDDLQRVRGIGRRQLDRIKQFLQVGSTGITAPVSALPGPPAYP